MPTLPLVLIVDDPSNNLTSLAQALSENFDVKVASSMKEALAAQSAETPPDMVLLSNALDGSRGPALLMQLKSLQSERCPVIYMSDSPTAAEEEQALEMGATDYIHKSAAPGVWRARLRVHLKASELNRQKILALTEEVARKSKELLEMQDLAAIAMASMAEIRDPDTVNHIRRTQHYVRTLARKLSGHSEYGGLLSLSYITTLFKTAPLHDIGKCGIPDRVLLKPGRLTPEETEIMRTHTTVGRDILENAEKSLDITLPFFTVAKEIAYSHHEKWDGTGYPLGLAGIQIPVSARLMALADVYDALITRRSYKEPMSHESALELIQSASGRHFDPHIVNAFVEVNLAFKTIAIAHSDGAHDYQKKADYKAIVYPGFRD